jgi:hypothetical protein
MHLVETANSEIRAELGQQIDVTGHRPDPRVRRRAPGGQAS